MIQLVAFAKNGRFYGSQLGTNYFLARYNDILSYYNDLQCRYNDLLSHYNDLVCRYNDLISCYNDLLIL